MKRHVLLSLPLICLVACASAPPRYYTLAAPRPPVVAAGAPRWVDVMPVGVPAQVDVPQLVVRRSAGELSLLERQQWAAPLREEIRTALVGELASQAGLRDVHGLPAPAAVPLYRLKLDLQAFETLPGQVVRWEAVWSLRGIAGSTLALTCVFAAEEPAAGDYAAAVGGHQRLLQRLARQIAGALETAVNSCPATP